MTLHCGYITVAAYNWNLIYVFFRLCSILLLVLPTGGQVGQNKLASVSSTGWQARATVPSHWRRREEIWWDIEHNTKYLPSVHWGVLVRILLMVHVLQLIASHVPCFHLLSLCLSCLSSTCESMLACTSWEEFIFCRGRECWRESNAQSFSSCAKRGS